VFVVVNGNPWELFTESLRQIAQDLVSLMPKIFIALIIFALTFLIIKILNISLRKLLRFAKLDEIIQKIAGFAFPFSLSNLLVFLADIGVALISFYAVVHLFLEAQYIQLVTEAIYYGARVISIIIIAIILFSIFGVAISRIRVETRLRGYTLFIILLLITAMLVDVTALSEHVKSALITGLSLGVGISVGVFAIWFFFHDYLDKMFLERKQKSTEKQGQT